KLSILIPAYNEADNIGQTIKDLMHHLPKMVDDYEILVVDDHSDDGTFQEVLFFQHPRISCIRLSRREGSHTAFRAGLEQLTGDAVICMAADGQEDISTIQAMVLKWQSGVNIVWALRQARKEPWHIKIFAVLFYKILGALSKTEKSSIDLSRADFFLLDRKVIEAIRASKERNTSLVGLISWLGFVQDAVEYERKERRSGTSKWNFKRRVGLAVDWIVAFSGIPLKLMTLVGFTFACLGFIYAGLLIINKYTGAPVEGWSSIIVVILVLGGLQMIMLGIMGEYLWRNLDESRKRPLFFIEKSSKD
ncbi:MAG: glycosyltransferase family 2 protein, partial [Candidatus Omnitrophica bacterium]|nr:glycosyltransferase family 2 protein [Candidatus Omnitrophota bacterium]